MKFGVPVLDVESDGERVNIHIETKHKDSDAVKDVMEFVEQRCKKLGVRYYIREIERLDPWLRKKHAISDSNYVAY